MERRFLVVLLVFSFLWGLSFLTVAPPLFGLSTILGVSVLGSSVLGSSVLGSSVLASTVIIEAYAQAVVSIQFGLSFVLIGLLVYLEFTEPCYRNLRSMLLEVRKSWFPVSGILLVLFSIFVMLKVWGIIVSQ